MFQTTNQALTNWTSKIQKVNEPITIDQLANISTAQKFTSREKPPVQEIPAWQPQRKRARTCSPARCRSVTSTGISKKFQIGSKRKRILKFPKIKIKFVEIRKIRHGQCDNDGGIFRRLVKTVMLVLRVGLVIALQAQLLQCIVQVPRQS